MGIRMWWGFSLDAWNNLIVAFGILSGMFALLTGGATYVAFQLQKAEADAAQRELDQYKLTVASQVSGAKAEAAHANEAAAKASERAAGLEKEAADARLETEQLKAQLAWRAISAEAATKLREALSGAPASVNIVFAASDAEGQAYAIQIAKVFDAAKWKVGLSSFSNPGAALFGILIPDEEKPADTTIREAFFAASIDFLPTSSGQLSFLQAGTRLGKNLPGAATVVVGSKKPTLPE